MLRISAFTVLMLSTAAMAADDDAKKALKSLEGEWKVVKLVAGGAAADADAIKTMSFTIKGDQLVPSDNPKDTATMVVDPSKKPASLDLKDTHNDTVLGIYELDGETLKICLGGEKGARPKEFKSEKGSKAVLIEMTKAKK